MAFIYQPHAGPNTVDTWQDDPLIPAGGGEWEGDGEGCVGLIAHGERQGEHCGSDRLMSRDALEKMLGSDYDGPSLCVAHARRVLAER